MTRLSRAVNLAAITGLIAGVFGIVVSGGATHVATAQAPGRVIRVMASGNNSGVGVTTQSECGSVASPCLTIQQALNHAQSGDIILLAAGVYQGDGPATISLAAPKEITIIGGYDPIAWDVTNAASVIDGGGVRRGVLIKETGKQVTFENVTFRNGLANDRQGAWGAMGGGLLCLGPASVVLRNVAFVGNKVVAPDIEAAGGGGAAFLWGGEGRPCPVTMENVSFDANEVRGGDTATGARGGHALGGGFFITHSDISATGVTLTRNRVWGGNGGTGSASSQFGRADALGGGAAIQFSNATLTNVLAADNHVVAGAGADYGGSGNGGGLFFELGVATVISATLRDNSATGGASPTGTGGIGGGGGLMIERQVITLERVQILNNRATGGAGLHSGHAGGGGMYLTQPRTVEAAPNRLTGNNVVIAANVAEAGLGPDRWGGGGGIFSQNTVLTLRHATIAYNRILPSMLGSAIVVLHDPGVGVSQADIRYSVIANHTGSDYARDAVLAQDAGTVVTLDHTLFHANASNSRAINGAHLLSSNEFFGDPRFVNPLGPVFDYHIGGTSAALNRVTGAAIPNDLDGQPRPMSGRSDLGADEIPLPLTMTRSLTPSAVRLSTDSKQLITDTTVLENTSGQPVYASFVLTLPSTNPPLTLGVWSGPACSIGTCRFEGGQIVWSGVVPAYGRVVIQYVAQVSASTTPNQPLRLPSTASLFYSDHQGQSIHDNWTTILLINHRQVMLPVVRR